MTATRFLQTGVHFLYGFYAWIALLVVVLPVTILLIVLPGIMRRRRVVRYPRSCLAVKRQIEGAPRRSANVYPLLFVHPRVEYRLNKR